MDNIEELYVIEDKKEEEPIIKNPRNKILSKYQFGDDVEVYGLDECLEYFSYGKITKVLDNFMYAIDGMSEPIKSSIIGKRSRLIRTFHESNLRKIEVRNEK